MLIIELTVFSIKATLEPLLLELILKNSITIFGEPIV